MDAVVQLHAVMHQVQTEPGPFSMSTDIGGWRARSTGPDPVGDLVPSGQPSQHPGVEAIRLAGQRRQPFHRVGVGDLHVQPGELQRVVHNRAPLIDSASA
jgi:hypothetical protein